MKKIDRPPDEDKETSLFSSPFVGPFVILLLVAGAGLVFYEYHFGPWKDMIRQCQCILNPKRLEAFIASYGVFAGFVFVGVQALQVVFAPIPGEMTGFVGGYLFGNVVGVILSTLGLTLGSLMAFFIGRIFGKPLVERIVREKYRDEFDRWVTHKGFYVVFLLYLIPGFPKDSLCYLVGLTHLDVTSFILMNIFGRLPGTVLLTLQGTAVDRGHYRTFFILLGCSLVVSGILYWGRTHCMTAFSAVWGRIRGKRVRTPHEDGDGHQ